MSSAVYGHWANARRSNKAQKSFYDDMCALYGLCCAARADLFLGIVLRENESLPAKVRRKLQCVEKKAEWWPITRRATGAGVPIYVARLTAFENDWSVVTGMLPNPFIYDAFIFSETAAGQKCHAASCGHEHLGYFMLHDDCFFVDASALTRLHFDEDPHTSYEDLIHTRGQVYGKLSG